MEIKTRWFKDGLDEDALKKEYRKLAKEYHPDRHMDRYDEYNAIFKEINRQFDDYFTNQKIREFEWMDTWAARRQAQRVRATVLIWLRRDYENPGKFFSFVERQYMGYWYWRTISQLKAITNDDKDWENFRGGLAYCTYGNPNEFAEVYLKKLPATISPATDHEMYYWNKDHFGDSQFHHMVKVRTRFGDFWATPERATGYILYAKAELPEEFLKIGNANAEEDQKYSARSIHTVYVNKKWIKEHKIIEECNGDEFCYHIYQDCSRDEFHQYHDVDWMPRFANEVGCKPITSDFYFLPDPIIAYYARQGIIRFYASSFNFRVRFGFFSENDLKKKMHLLSIDDAELIQDYLDEINKEFDEHVKSLVRKGRIRVKI